LNLLWLKPHPFNNPKTKGFAMTQYFFRPSNGLDSETPPGTSNPEADASATRRDTDSVSKWRRLTLSPRTTFVHLFIVTLEAALLAVQYVRMEALAFDVLPDIADIDLGFMYGSHLMGLLWVMTDAAVVMIAGNHDSGDRIASMSIMTDRRRALIRGVVSAEETPLVLKDEHGPVAFSGLPFSYEYAARECFSDESLQMPEDVITAQVTAKGALQCLATFVYLLINITCNNAFLHQYFYAAV
jgi:hypothetical protein